MSCSLQGTFSCWQTRVFDSWFWCVVVGWFSGLECRWPIIWPLLTASCYPCTSLYYVFDLLRNLRIASFCVWYVRDRTLSQKWRRSSTRHPYVIGGAQSIIWTIASMVDQPCRKSYWLLLTLIWRVKYSTCRGVIFCSTSLCFLSIRRCPGSVLWSEDPRWCQISQE